MKDSLLPCIHALDDQPLIWGLLSRKDALLMSQTKHGGHAMSFPEPYEATSGCSFSLVASKLFHLWVASIGGWELCILAGYRPQTRHCKIKMIRSSPLALNLLTTVGFPQPLPKPVIISRTSHGYVSFHNRVACMLSPSLTMVPY